MREDELRSILLVKAIEEADREGTILPPADRLAASRDAKREGGGEPDRMLARRARALLAKVTLRHPFIDDVVRHAGGVPWLAWVAIVAAFFGGVAMSALDGTRRIDVLSLPLLGLVAYNLVIYVSIVLRRHHRPLVPTFATHAALGQLSALIARSRNFNAPLAAALSTFLHEWQEAARPLLLARAARMLHLAAASLGLGLVAGLYLRGIAFDFRAGWDSTFLDAAGVRNVLAAFYGPASWLTGIAIPDAARLEAIRWRNGGGESAAAWIHLLAATAFLFVILPRLALAGLATLRIHRWMRETTAPVSVASYARIAFSGVGGLVDRGVVMVVPYACEPDPNSLARLRTLLASEMGEHLAIDQRAPVRYGEEEAFVRDVGEQGGSLADVIVILASLAATPEDENHGLVVEGVRDWMAKSRPRAQLVVMVDESPYVARVPPERVEERRRAWQAFIAARGVEPRFVNLA